MKARFRGVKRWFGSSLWALAAVVALLGLASGRVAAEGLVPGVMRLVKADPGWTYGSKIIMIDRWGNPTYGPYDNSPTGLVALQDTLLFWGYDSVRGYELWRSDGTAAGTRFVKELLGPGPGSSTLNYGIAYNGHYFFLINDCRQLWRTDGTTSGTVLLKDLGDSGSIVNTESSMIIYKGKVYFCTIDAIGSKLWRTDGTPQGTDAFYSIPKTATYIYPERLAPFFFEYGGLLYFHLFEVNNNADPPMSSLLYCTDGSESGSRFVKKLDGEILAKVGNALCYAYDPDTASKAGYLRKYDLMTGADTLLKDGFAAIVGMAEKASQANGLFYFFANDQTHGFELWKSDGTAAGTVMVRDLAPGGDSFHPSYVAIMNGVAYFGASLDGGGGTALYRSDGTAAGTKAVHPALSGKTSITLLGQANNVLYLQCDGALWRSDGTVSGTMQVPIDAPAGEHYPQTLCAVGDRVFLSAHYSASGGENNHGMAGIWAVDMKMPNAVVGWEAYR